MVVILVVLTRIHCQYVCQYLGFAQIEMHSLVRYWQSVQLKVTHAVDFKLEGKSWLKVSVD